MLIFPSGFGINLRRKKCISGGELPLLTGHLPFDKQTQKQPLARWVQPSTFRGSVLVCDHKKGRSYQDSEPCQEVGKSLQEAEGLVSPFFPDHIP